jgi:alkanesulfonate monooxygenase SsuD/methylene tetrahydromethanopterin reductase-like flavin-dependent oxidoreductase (luciferase family)
VAKQLILSVVDQSPVRQGGTAAEALRETIELAAACEKLGYKRYWVAEHHSLPGFAGTCPEIMVGQIAARTSTIRVGSGGVMLSHYSALKVAETFRMLESLYPGRIDLGIGRAPGSDQRTAAALSYPGPMRDISYFPEQVDDVIGFLKDELTPDPTLATLPEVWLLGSGYDSALLAAERGLPFSYAYFFGIGVEHGPAIVENYRRRFRPSEHLSEPKVNGLRIITGRRGGVPPVEEALAYPYSPQERAYLEHSAQTTVDGDPRQVREKLEALAEVFHTDDLSVVTICYNFADRVRSYELVAEACGLK